MNKPTFVLLAAALCAPLWAAVTEQDVAAARVPALAGEAPATAQLFRLYDGADGAVAEWINETLGQVAQAHPKLFLTELVSYNGGAACTNIAALGPDFVDAFALQADELSARRAALQSVDDAALETARDHCMLACCSALPSPAAVAALPSRLAASSCWACCWPYTLRSWTLGVSFARKIRSVTRSRTVACICWKRFAPSRLYSMRGSFSA